MRFPDLEGAQLAAHMHGSRQDSEAAGLIGDANGDVVEVGVPAGTLQAERQAGSTQGRVQGLEMTSDMMGRRGW